MSPDGLFCCLITSFLTIQNLQGNFFFFFFDLQFSAALSITGVIYDNADEPLWKYVPMPFCFGHRVARTSERHGKMTQEGLDYTFIMCFLLKKDLQGRTALCFLV